MVESSVYDSLKMTYQGKKVFLTGHTGFKGAWMLKILNMLGAKVKGYALIPMSEDDLFHLIKGSEICDSTIADLRDKVTLNNAIKDFQPDYVFHLAAQPLVRLSYQIPSETFEINAIGTANLLDAIALLDKQCQIVMITTDKVYYNNEREYSYRENDRLGGFDPYSASKACAELVIDSYRNSFFNNKQYEYHKKSIAVARAGNVIGGGDWSQDRLIPDLIRALITNQAIKVRNPNAVRPWQHVLEPITGYLILGQKLSTSPLKFSQAYNFGPFTSNTLPVIQIVKQAITAFGTGNFEIEQIPNQPHEACLLQLDINKVLNDLKWKPRMNAEQTIAATIDWYKFYIDGNDMNNFTEEQIKLYFTL